MGARGCRLSPEGHRLKHRITDSLRQLERRALWKIAEWAINRCEERFLLSPAMKYQNLGYYHACQFIEENLSHFVWGHPEMGVKEYVAWVAYERKESEPESED